MGKIRKLKPSKHKKGGADNSDEEEQVPIDSKENAIQTILDQLQVSKPNFFFLSTRSTMKLICLLFLSWKSILKTLLKGEILNLSSLFF